VGVSRFRRTYAPLILTLLEYLRTAPTHTPCMGSLSSRYPSCPVCSCRGLLTCLACPRCPHGICHAWHAIVAVFSHALHGLVVLPVSIMSGVLLSLSSHTSCVGSFSSRYRSRPACSRCGPLTHLAWARCSYRSWWSQRQFMGRAR